MTAPRAGDDRSRARRCPCRSEVEGVWPCRPRGRCGVPGSKLHVAQPQPASELDAAPGAARRSSGTSRRSSSRRLHRPCSRRVCADRGQLLGDVDPDRAPRDAAPAADAARAAELVVPGAELVRQPLAVARALGAAARCRRAGRSGRPRSRTPRRATARRLRAGEIADVLDARAEAGRADHRAVAAGQAALARPPPSAGARGCARAGRAGRRPRPSRPIAAAAAGSTAAARRRGRALAASRRGSSREQLGAALAIRPPTRKRCSPSRISVSARS